MNSISSLLDVMNDPPRWYGFMSFEVILICLVFVKKIEVGFL